MARNGFWGGAWIAAYARLSPRSWAAIPRPPAHQVVFGPGPRPDRILLCGASSAVGFGVLHHELGLAGHLARSVAGVTGRGTEVEVIAEPGVSFSAVGGILTDDRRARSDAIVLTIGTREAFEFMSVRRWSAQLTELLDRLRPEQGRPFVLLVGAEEASPVPFPWWIAAAVARRARALNAASRRIVAGRSNVAFVDSGLMPPPGVRGLYDVDKADLYQRAALALTPALGGGLDALPPRHDHPVDEPRRLATAQRLRYLPEERKRELAALVTTLRRLLDADDAVLVAVDDELVWPIVADRDGSGPRARAGSLSAAVIERGSLAIRDLDADPVLRRPGSSGQPHMRAYAAHPVLADDGEPIAVLGVADAEPRDFGPTELALVREYAARVTAILAASLASTDPRTSP